MTVEFLGIHGFGQVGGVGKTDRNTKTRQTDKAGDSEGANFSSALHGAHQMQAASHTDQPERAAKVQALKEQVANGSYEPDLNKVASSLLKFLVEEG